MKILKKIISVVLLSVVLSSCEKEFLEVSPTDAFDKQSMFTTLEGANLALNGMYRYMFALPPGFGRTDNFGHSATLLEMDFMGDDMVRNASGTGWFVGAVNWTQHRSAVNIPLRDRWRFYYALINNANQIINNIDGVPGSQAVKDNIEAQALAMRAFSYYYLVQLFSPAFTLNPNAPGVPIYTETTMTGNPRAPLSEVYNRITTDLTDAIALFAGNNMQRHRSHINLAVAHGLFARVGLAMGNFAMALQHATSAITIAEASGRALFFPAVVNIPNDGGFATHSAVNVGSVFNTVAGSEWMWGSEIQEDQATIFASLMAHMDSRFLSHASSGNRPRISQALYNLIPLTDVRRTHWVPVNQGVGAVSQLSQLKFGVRAVGTWAADVLYMRLAEMYLIRAEAAARLGGAANETIAREALFSLVSRRDPAYVLSINTGAALIDEIMFHRRVELWGEGFRFIDLKRLNLPLVRPTAGTLNHSAALAVVTTMPAGDNRWVWMIPISEFDANPKLDRIADQNP